MVDWPQGVLTILSKLDRGGHQAWAVGGCVRDLLLGRAPHDWDVCTSATPAQMRTALEGLRLIETGLKHGTLTVLTPMPVEVTTYRVDGPYADHRRPAAVHFVKSLEEDLARRDFTINAMALRPDRGLKDLFGGQEDLRGGLVRCVGDPRQRFGEDALRMLRCLRFAAQLDFTIERHTAIALRECWPALAFVSKERVGAEYLKMLIGPGAGRVLANFRSQLDQITPLRQLIPEGIDLLPQQPALRMAFVLAGDDRLDSLRLDKRTCRQTRTLLRLRARPLPAERSQLLSLLGEAGEATVRDLLAIWAAEGRDVTKTTSLMEALLREGAPCRLRDLAINGDDLVLLGLSGPQIGRALEQLLDQVMAGNLPNRREALLSAAMGRK